MNEFLLLITHHSVLLKNNEIVKNMIEYLSCDKMEFPLLYLFTISGLYSSEHENTKELSSLYSYGCNAVTDRVWFTGV